MKFLNGWKTVIGFAGMAATIIATGGHADIGAKVAEIAAHADSVVTGVFGALFTLGVIHKVEKRAS